MSKRTKKINHKCEHYQFYLKPQHNLCKFSQTISVSFCDSSKHKCQKQTSVSSETPCLECPVFNKDSNYATPTFILHSQKQHFHDQGQRLRIQHEKKMTDYTDEKDSLNLPKPRSKNSFCNVCRQVYDDYLNHIQSDGHKKCIKGSTFNKSILQLVQKFNPPQNSSISFIQNTRSTQDDDDVEILYCKSKKKVKQVQQNFQKPHQQFLNPHNFPPPQINMNNPSYFTPNPYQQYMPNSGFNYFLQPFSNFNAVDMFNCRQIGANQINSNYQYPNLGFINPWSEYFAQYQRNLISFQTMNQQNQILQQNLGLLNNFQEKNKLQLEQKNVIQINDDEDKQIIMIRSNRK